MDRTSTKYSGWDKAKKIFYFVLIFLSSGLYFFLAFKGFKDQSIDLTTLKKYTGQINSVGETIRKSGKNRPKVFYVQLEGLEQRLGVYRMSRNYESILNKLNAGDTITAYYKDQNPCDVNIDLVQIEKHNTIILDKEEYMNKESSLIWIGLVGGAFSILLSIWYLKKHVLILFKDNEKE